MKNKLFFLCLVIIFSSCEKQNNETIAPVTDCSTSAGYTSFVNKISVVQGVYGIVHFTQGNCMPTIDRTPTDCQTCPVKRKVRIYAYTRLADAIVDPMQSGFFTSFSTRLITEVESDANGFFQVNLQPGTYTMVVVENGKLYAKNGDGSGGINPFTVDAGIKQVDISITYKATF